MLERDGILSALLIIQMMEFRGKSFDEILRGVEHAFGKFYYVRKDLSYPDNLKPELLAQLNQFHPKSIAGSGVTGKVTKDGFQFTLDGDAWVLFRLSGTEPLLRIYGESTRENQAHALVEWGQQLALSIR